MKKIKKLLLLFIGILFVSLVSSTNILAANDPTYTFDATSTYTSYEHVLNKEMKGELKVRSYTTNVVANFLDFNMVEDNLHMVPISLYDDFAWGMKPLSEMIKQYELENPHLEVVAAINADFYDINNTGRPQSNHIENYKVIKGTPSGAPLVIIREDGSTEIGYPRAEGYEVLVFNEFNEIKFRQKIDHINNANTTNANVSLFSSGSNISNINNLDTILVNAKDIKYQVDTLQLAEGPALKHSNITEITEEQFVMAGQTINDAVEDGDYIVVQVKLAGFEDVRGAVGGHGTILLKDGVVPDNIEDCGFFCKGQRAPRTAVGIREDGSVFWLVSNGRDTDDNVPGLQMLELAELMLSQGAYNAINLDGGGSSTMIVKDSDGSLKYLNKLSDGRERSISNGVLLVRGDIPSKPINIQGLAARTSLDTPQNVMLNADNVIKFDPVDGASNYYLEINNNRYEINSTSYNLNILPEGEYSVRVLAKGTATHLTSEASASLTFKVKYRSTNEVIEWIKGFARNNN